MTDQKITAAIEAGEIADFANPPLAADSTMRALFTSDEGPTACHWNGDFYVHRGTHYSVEPIADLRALGYAIGPAASQRPVRKSDIDNWLDALHAKAHLSIRAVPTAPAWLVTRPGDPEACDVIAVRNGLFRIDTRQLLPATPRYFTLNALPFDIPVNIPPPVALLAFLRSVWQDDEESINCLQEWVGLLLTHDTSLQKALLIVGPPRSGKGVIGRLAVALLGIANVASPALGSLGQPFGLQAAIGKMLLLFSDARLGKHDDIAAITETLLRVIGEDLITVPRKFQADYTAKLSARVVMLSNEMPSFRDAAAALPSRFIVLRTTRSFLGQEDRQLEQRLHAELPSILVWALEGLLRLRERGRFVQPRSAREEMQLMEDLASPIRAFLRDRCLLEPGAEVSVGGLYSAWSEWCINHHRDRPGTEQTFGRDIAAAAPGLRVTRPRIAGERVRMYSGIRLRTPDDPDAAEEDDAD